MSEEGEGEEGEEKKELKKQPPTKPIEQLPPLERKPEFANMIKLFMGRTGQTREQAVAFLGNLFDRMNISPEKNLEEAMRAANTMATILQMYPETPVTAGLKQTARDVGMSKILQRVTSNPEASERMVRMMEAVGPYMAMAPMMREMGRLMGGGDTQGKSSEVEALKAELDRMREDMKSERFSRSLEDRFSKLDQRIEKLSETMTARKPEEGEVMAKKLDELKTTLAGSKESDVAKKIDELTKTLTERKHEDEMEKVAEKMEDIKNSFEQKIAGLQQSMNKGEPQKDVIGQASELLTSMGNYFKGFGETARSMGYEPKDEKLSGDLKRDMVNLGKKALEVVEKSVRYKGKPPKQPVQQLPPSPAPATIPIPAKAPEPASPKPEKKAEAEAPSAPPEEVIPPESPERPSKLGLWVPKKAKAETPEGEPPQEGEPQAEEKPAEEPTEAPTEEPKKGGE